jgi:hypothetical protein
MQTNTIPSPPSTLTFVLDLGDGTRCLAIIDVARMAALPPDGLFARLLETKIEGVFKPSHFDRYRAWIADVWQTVADAANKSVTTFLITPQGSLLAIVCEPNQRPEFFDLPLPREP